MNVTPLLSDMLNDITHLLKQTFINCIKNAKAATFWGLLL